MMFVSRVTVMVRNYHDDAKWIPETVLKKLTPVIYISDMRYGRTVKQHIDQLSQNVHYSLESTSNPINHYYYSYEPVTPVQDVDPVPQTPP